MRCAKCIVLIFQDNAFLMNEISINGGYLSAYLVKTILVHKAYFNKHTHNRDQIICNKKSVVVIMQCNV